MQAHEDAVQHQYFIEVEIDHVSILDVAEDRLFLLLGLLGGVAPAGVDEAVEVRPSDDGGEGVVVGGVFHMCSRGFIGCVEILIRFSRNILDYSHRCCVWSMSHATRCSVGDSQSQGIESFSKHVQTNNPTTLDEITPSYQSQNLTTHTNASLYLHQNTLQCDIGSD